LFNLKKFTNLRELSFYVLGGGTGAVLNLGTAFVLTSILHVYYFYSYIVGSLINYTFNFIFHRAITFNVRDKAGKRAAYYYISNIVLGAVSLLLVYTFTSIIGLNYLVSGLIATVLVVIVNFFFSKLVTFKEKI
jgi:putative flippase GtrA